MRGLRTNVLVEEGMSQIYPSSNIEQDSTPEEDSTEGGVRFSGPLSRR